MKENPYEIAKQQIEIAAKKAKIDEAIVEWLKKPQWELTVNFPVKMDDGSTEIFTGYRVQHSMARGSCKGCKLCIEFCPEDALEESPEFNTKCCSPPRLVEKDDNSAYVGCGFCEQICPEFAIYSMKEEEIEKMEG